MSSSDSVIHIPPFYYAHILDQNTNITSLVVGPSTFSLQVNQKLVFGPGRCVIIPPNQYCIIQNPVKGKKSESEYSLRIGHREIRFEQDPFPLYPGEVLEVQKQMTVIPSGSALNLLVVDDFEDEKGNKHLAGQEFQIKGPSIYRPRIEVNEQKIVAQIVVNEGEALKLKARADLIDGNGVKRATGDIWLMSEPGPYILKPYEILLEKVSSHILTDDVAVHLKSDITHKDIFEIERKAGDEWLVTREQATTYTPDVKETLVGVTNKTIVKKGEFCVVLNPHDQSGKPQFGKKKLVQGPVDFFLKPHEVLESGIRANYVLDAFEAIVLKANQEFTDTNDSGNPKGVKRIPGEKWMLSGPTEYVPPIEVTVLETRKAIPLDINDGVYVRNNLSGKVRSVMGPQSYMLQVNETLYEKELSPLVEELLKSGGGKGEDEDIRKVAYFSSYVDPALLKGARDKTRVVKYKVPPGTAAKISDNTTRTSRVLFGPDLAILEPYEDFNILSLSAGRPKKTGALKSLVLFLGPDYITDIIKVETCDHAVLNIRVSYNNKFLYDVDDKSSHEKIFSVPDFIGYTCSVIGARIREHVAQVTFDQFHKKSSSIIEEAVFFNRATGKVDKEVLLESNNLIIDNVDILSIEPSDAQVLASLTKSVQMAIEIATKTIEIRAKNESLYEHQKAVGALEIQKLADELEKEKSRYALLEIVAKNAAIESCGAAVAEAQARSESLIIEGESHVKLVKLQAEAKKIEFETELELQNKQRELEILHARALAEMEIKSAKDQADLEVFRVESFVNSLSKEAILSIARAGPEMKAKLLGSLGIQTTLITDGNSPINLFDSANGIISIPH